MGDLKIAKKDVEVFEDDIGFGYVKVTSDGVVLDVEKLANHDDVSTCII